MKISIIIPAYNEEKRIVQTLRDVLDYQKRHSIEFECLVVDDGSTDQTGYVSRTVGEGIRVLRHEMNRGKGYSVRKGVRYATGDYILFMDADGATPIDQLENFLPYIEEKVDVIVGSRNLRDSQRKIDQPIYRRALGRVANLLIQIFAVWNIRDTQCGFKCFRHDVAKHVFANQKIDGWGFDFEVLALSRKYGYSLQEVPIDWYHSGETRVRPIRGAMKTLIELFRVRWNLMMGRYED